MGQNPIISAMSMAILSEIEALLPCRGAEVILLLTVFRLTSIELEVAELKHLRESIGKSM